MSVQRLAVRLAKDEIVVRVRAPQHPTILLLPVANGLQLFHQHGWQRDRASGSPTLRFLEERLLWSPKYLPKIDEVWDYFSPHRLMGRGSSAAKCEENTVGV